MKTVTLFVDHKHGDTQYYAGQSVPLPDADAEWLADAIVQTRVELREKAVKVMSVLTDGALDV